MDNIEIVVDEAKKTSANYISDNITIATICSHTSLQLFHAARQQGFKTLGIIRRSENDTRESYNYFPLAAPDEFFDVDNYLDLLEKAPELLERNVVFVPHGSAVEYLRMPDGRHALELLRIPTYGNRRIIPYEFDRRKQREWLEKEAGLLMPKEFLDPREIKQPVIVKRQGAPGGRGSAVVTSYEEYRQFVNANQQNDYNCATIQQFIPGTRYYLQFFATPFCQFNGSNLEFFGADRRDESDADEFYKIGTRRELLEKGMSPTYNVTGNVQVVLRESILMRDGIPAGRKTLDASKRLVKDGMIGPFCLETIVDPNSRMYVFEISARIVAGSNILTYGSAYGLYTYPEPMTYGRRIMLDIAEGLKRRELYKVIS